MILINKGHRRLRYAIISCFLMALCTEGTLFLAGTRTHTLSLSKISCSLHIVAL
uniref:Uncharacterized protein n=1 Tax=Rhizophora mucronata TaxID=61149 RepID=A0A2P2PRR4_RHIMU